MKTGSSSRPGKKVSTTASRTAGPDSLAAIPWPVPPCGLEDAVALIDCYATDLFSLSDAVTAIRKNARVRNPDPAEHIRALLNQCGNLGRIPDADLFAPNRTVFKDAAFLIAPTAQELQLGVLIPGHRFFPFLDANMTPDDITLTDADGTPYPKTALRRPFQDIVVYHSLLPLVDTMGLFVQNEVTDFRSFDSDTIVTLNVLDLSGFYKANEANDKGLLLVRVTDVAKGVFQITYADTATRFSLQKHMHERDNYLEKALLALMPEIGPDLPMDLLRDAYAHLYRDGVDLSEPASPFGIWLNNSSKLTVGFYQSRPCLVPAKTDPVDFYGEFEIPDYDGRCETMEDLFNKAGLSLDRTYVRAVILDTLDQNGTIEQAVKRMFEGREIPQWDTVDWTFFQQEYSRFWQEIETNKDDWSPNKTTRDLRRDILQACEDHLSMLRAMDRSRVSLEDLPAQEMGQLAMLDSLYTTLLGMLESPLSSKELKETRRMFKELSTNAEQLRTVIEESLEDLDEEEDTDGDWVTDETSENYLQTYDIPVDTVVLKVKFQQEKSIWRSLELAQSQTLHTLSRAILDAIDWDSDHLYSFFMSNRAWDEQTEYTSPLSGEGQPADTLTLADLDLKPKQKFLFLYDYGDEHLFEVEVVSLRKDAPPGEYPQLVASQGDAPGQYPDYE